MEQKQLKSCLITLTARGPSKLLIAQGFAKTPGVIGRGALLIRPGRCREASRMLEERRRRTREGQKLPAAQRTRRP
jgi:hypothetical protein